MIIPENIRTIHINNLLNLGFRSKNNPRKRKKIDNVIISLLLNLGTKSGVPKIKVPNHEKTIPMDTPLILIFLLLCGMAEKIKVIAIKTPNKFIKSRNTFSTPRDLTSLRLKHVKIIAQKT